MVLVVLLLTGWLGGYLQPGSAWSCTEMGCPCQGVEGERPCNNCFSTDYVFFTGLFNLKQRCTAPETIECRNGDQVDRRVDYTQQDCQLKLELLGVNWHYLFDNPEQQTGSKFNPPH